MRPRTLPRRISPLPLRAAVSGQSPASPQAASSDGGASPLELRVLQLGAKTRSQKLRTQRLEAAQERRDAALEEKLRASQSKLEERLSDTVTHIEALQQEVESLKAAAPVRIEPKRQRLEKHASTGVAAVEAITYDVAFEQIGGQTTLATYASLSAQLAARTGDPALDTEVSAPAPPRLRRLDWGLLSPATCDRSARVTSSALRRSRSFFHETTRSVPASQRGSSTSRTSAASRSCTRRPTVLIRSSTRSSASWRSTRADWQSCRRSRERCARA